MSQNRSEITCSKCKGKQKPLAEYRKTAEFPEGDRNQPICMPCYQKDRNSSPKVTRMKRVNLISRAQINLESVFLAVEDPDKPLIQVMQDELESLVHRLSAKLTVEEDRNATAVKVEVAAEDPDPGKPLPPPTELSNIQPGDYFVSKMAAKGNALLRRCTIRKSNGNILAETWSDSEWKPATVVPSTALVTPLSPEDAEKQYACFNIPADSTSSKEPEPLKSQAATL